MDATSAADGVPGTEALLPGLLGVVESTLRDLHPGVPDLPAVTLDSVLDRDLGLDSLSRMELLLRIERELGLALPEDTLQRAETVADLLQAARRASPAMSATVPSPVPRRPGVAGAEGSATPSLPFTEAGATLRVQHAGPALGPDPGAATTLLEVLDAHLRLNPEQVQVICLADAQQRTISYRQLADSAAVLAAGLQRAGVRPRQCVAIMLPTSPEYFSTYFGILRAGAIPVPIYPPARPSQLEDHVLRHTGILANAGAVLMVTVPEAIVVARLLQARVPGLRHVATPQQLSAAGGVPEPVNVRADDIAFIQYTSGSTGQPKGVALTHANLLANIRAMAQAVQATRDDVFVSWLPLYHDMGLIGAWLAGLVVGFPLVVMSPLAFLARPQRWLRAIHEHGGTLSAAPNFAYELCLKRIDDADLAGLDLGSWRLAFNGAEAVSPDTVQQFQQRFAAFGLRAEAMAPVYGLAEACVGLLFPPLGRGLRVDRIEREALALQHRAVPAAAEDATALRFVACGRALPGHEVRLLDEAGRELGERVEGRLEFRGPSATHGYYRNPQQTQALIHDGWIDTGDRAYRVGDELFLTGRVKDIVIRGGRNLYPQEIEEAVGAVDGVRKGCVAVFGSADPATGTERLVVLAEARAGDAQAQARLREAVARAVHGAIGEPPDLVVLAPPHTVLKTSSGKVRRSACRALYESGKVGAGSTTLPAQVLRLAAGALAPRLRQAASGLGHTLYGLHAWAMFGLLVLPTWLLTACLPAPATAWRVSRVAACALLRLIGIPLEVRGLEHLPAGPCVLVANHGSYLDGAILVAALPRHFAFVAKGELQRQFIARTYLQRMGAEFVERFDAQRGVADATRLAEAAAAGRSLAVFPEGTFVAAPGLLPFHLGGFLAAAHARVPVVPVVLRGHRELLREGSWWPRHTRLQVEVCAPVSDAGEGTEVFAAAARLREAARNAIARRMGPAD